jgi:hypothetical protein
VKAKNKMVLKTRPSASRPFSGLENQIFNNINVENLDLSNPASPEA